MITRQDAYETAFFFLSLLYLGNRARFSGDFPLLLGRMQILPDGRPIDPLIAHFWEQAAPDDLLDDRMTMGALERFLDFCRSRGETHTLEISLVLYLLRSEQAQVWREWFATAVERLADQTRVM